MEPTTQFQSTHNLDFECSDELFMGEWIRFRVGTCFGIWKPNETFYEILAIENHAKGNGHFDDVLEWFEQSCKRDGRSLRILELSNKGLMNHLITKRGFVQCGEQTVVKSF